jgi:hypothetical protein
MDILKSQGVLARFKILFSFSGLGSQNCNNFTYDLGSITLGLIWILSFATFVIIY